MPKLWDDSIETHRRAVREAIMDTTWRLVVDRGPLSVTMSRVAAETGIGRATLYKYFPDVESILLAQHQRQVAAHLDRLTVLRDRPGPAAERLAAVFHEFARICHHRGRHGSEDLAALVHKGERVRAAEDRVRDLVGGLLADAAEEGAARTDPDPRELANFCVHALTAAGSATDEAAVDRLVALTLEAVLPTPFH